MLVTRRSFVSLGAVVMAAPALAGKRPGMRAHPVSGGAFASIEAALDDYVHAYLDDLGAPGLTLALADRDGTQLVKSYGYADVKARVPITPDDQFQIGSITKSFVALCLLQLVEEGRIALDDPIDSRLPGLAIDAPFGPIRLRHLMTHSSGLPDGALFPPLPRERHRAVAPPGRDFHYCNLGWTALGHLVAHCDQRTLGESIRARILEPLRMSKTAPVTNFDDATRLVQSYWPAVTDRPYPVHGALVPAPRILTTDGAGCIASTPADMAHYLTMLINEGATPDGRLLSPASFTAFSTPYIEAAEFGNDAAYGFGIAVDHFDGHRRLRHTGGMVSFASALEVDRDTGVGVFASVNAMQGVRPRPVAEYALRLMRAVKERRTPPARPARLAPREVAQPGAYTGRYLGENGASIMIVADGVGVSLVLDDVRLPLEPVGGNADVCVVRAPGHDRDLVVFERAAEGRAAHGFGWGAQRYAREGTTLPPAPAAPAAWTGYVGHYRSEDPWIGSHHVLLRGGRLWLDGAVPLEPGEDGRFYLRDEPMSPEWVQFLDPLYGRSMTLSLSGNRLARLMTA
jgi:CubicO group peptidase (beta-lactamase class C family)